MGQIKNKDDSQKDLFINEGKPNFGFIFSLVIISLEQLNGCSCRFEPFELDSLFGGIGAMPGRPNLGFLMGGTDVTGRDSELGFIWLQFTGLELLGWEDSIWVHPYASSSSELQLVECVLFL